DAFGVDVEIVIRKHHLPHVFPANVLAEASASAAQTVAALEGEQQIPSRRYGMTTKEQGMTSEKRGAVAGRRDFRWLNIVTIDGETARDFDDAVLVRPLRNGNWELQVHIADVSHYVRPGPGLDLAARLRRPPVYFRDRARPMLPAAPASGWCSLRPDGARLVLSGVRQMAWR